MDTHLINTLMDYDLDCEACDKPILPITVAQTGKLCATCRDKNAIKERSSWCVAPLHKGPYMLITDPALLVGLNNKGGLVK